MKLKLFLPLIAIAMGFGSCTNDLVDEVSPIMGNRDVISVSMENTRTAMDGTEVIWSDNDAIGIFIGATNNEYALATGAGTTSAEFQSSGLVSQATKEVAYFPYVSTATWASNILSTTLPNTYTYAEGTNNNAVMAALMSAENQSSISFKNAGALYAITIENIPAGYAKAVMAYTNAEDNVAIAGAATITFDGEGNPTLAVDDAASAAEAQKTITITFDAADAPTTKTFYFPMPVKVGGGYAGKLQFSLQGDGKDAIEAPVFTQEPQRSKLYAATLTLDAVNGGIVTEALDVPAANEALEDATSVAVKEVQADDEITIPTKSEDSAEVPHTIDLSEATLPASGTVTIAVETTGTGEAPVENLTVVLPENADTSNLVINAPATTVTITTADGTVIDTIEATTAENTLIIAEGVTINKLNINGGNVRIEGGIVKEVTNNLGKNITYFVETAEQLRNIPIFATEVILADDIDLNNEQWTPIGTPEKPFSGTLNGMNHTIKNLSIIESEAKEGKAYIGLFGYAKDATIKDVTFENVNINIPCLDIDHSQGHIGAVAGSLEGTSTIENVTVKGDIKVEATVSANGASRVAVVAGGNSYGNVTMKNVHVIANVGSYLKANNNTGALAGQLQGKNIFENCSSNIDVTVTKFFAGGLIGIAAGDSKFTDCHTTGDVTVTAGREGRHNDEYRVGGIAGGWADGASKVCTLINCSYTGTISGTNADGAVAEPLDYDGYVGRGYTLSNCAGSKVVIDGKEFVQASNSTYGIYIVNGVYEIGTAAALKWLANEVNSGADYFAGKTVKLVNDIDLNNVEWSPIGSAYKDHGFMGNFDGNNKTIKNLSITNITPDSDGYVYAGLFGVTEGTDENNQNNIKNLTIENVNIATEGHIVAAAIAYPYYTIVENITVKGDIKIEGGDYTAGVLAYTRRCVEAKNLVIVGNSASSITGNYTVGGVISDIQMNGGLTADYTNFKASGLTISGGMHVGGISGIISGQTLDGATVENVTIVCDNARKGIVSGSLGEKSTIKNISWDNVIGAENVVGATYDSGVGVVVNGDDYEMPTVSVE